MGKKHTVSVTYENESISIKNSLRLSCVVHGPIYGRFMGFSVPARGFGYTVSRAILIQVYGIFWSKFGYKVFSFS